LPGLLVAPAQQAQQAALRVGLEELRRAHRQVRPALAFVVFDRRQQAPGVVLQPLAAAEFAQPRVDRVVQREQVLHVVCGVLELRVGQRPAHPVRTGLALGQDHAGDLRDQLLVAHATADAGQRGADLGIEQWPRQGATGALECHQVLAGAVHDLEDGVVLQPRTQGLGHAGYQRVDQQDLVAHRHLHQRQLRPVGAFADEFGVQADAVGALAKAFFKFGGVSDPVSHVQSINCRVCPGRRE